VDAALAGGDHGGDPARGYSGGARLAEHRAVDLCDKAILAATDECLAGKSISDAAWAEVAKHVTEPGQQVEFIIAMGNWMMFSLLFRNLRIPLAEGVMVWPPDGLASPAAEG